MNATTTGGDDDLIQILKLQSQNLKGSLKEEEIKDQGFLTIAHDLQMLQAMHSLAPSIIIKDNEKVVAYALTMLRECNELIDGLTPMFNMFDSLNFNREKISELNYYVMGQICVDKNYRGMGLFDELYNHHKKVYEHRFDILLTEISTSNTRSIRAHERVGFKEIGRFTDKLDNWSIVGWPYKSIS